uniref:Thioredoxin domain-containing protein 9 n=1 Tax=Parastrongyloides trichosuri TaxID=131310 RepID=A0A0N4Z2N5_PARTI
MDQLSAQLLQAAKVVEQQVDQQIAEFDNLDENGFEEIRRKRLAEMKEQAKKKKEWMENGHGKYEELSDETQFFNAAKKSDHFVCHFYKPDQFRCKVVDKLLEMLSKKYIGTKFVSVNCEKFPFLIKRLNIRVIPTIGISMDAKMCDYIRVFEELGDKDDISIDVLEERLARSGVIDMPIKKKVKTTNKTKIIRGKLLKDEDSDNDN